MEPFVSFLPSQANPAAQEEANSGSFRYARKSRHLFVQVLSLCQKAVALSRPPAASAGALPLTFFYGINNLRRSISGRPADLCRIVAKESTRSNRAVLQVIENKDQQSGDPLSPRRITASGARCLFSSTCISSRCGRLVEACGAKWKLVASSSYDFIYKPFLNGGAENRLTPDRRGHDVAPTQRRWGPQYLVALRMEGNSETW